jgi:hypothetical protein
MTALSASLGWAAPNLVSYYNDFSVLFVWAYQSNMAAIQQCFSLTINLPTVLSAMAVTKAKKFFLLCICLL